MIKAQTQFQCQCLRRHTIFDQKYILTLTNDQITLNQPGKDIKYTIQLQLKSWIDWNVDQNYQLESFTIIWNDQHKKFHANSENLVTLKSLISNKIMFKNIHVLYQPMLQLGEGDFGEIYMSRSLLTGEQFAIRCLQKYQYQENMVNFDLYFQQSVYNEIECNREIESEYVQKLYEVYHGDNAVYLIQEFVNGTNLMDIVHFIKLDYFQIKLIMKQLLLGVRDIHEKKIIHRDIKPANIIFKFEDNLDELKIVDFGLALKTLTNQKIIRQCGTPGFVAPEIFRDITIDKCDLFSVGCIFYRMLTNRDLFSGKSTSEILKMNKACNIDFNVLQLYKISNIEIDLLKQLLDINPLKRISAEDALLHEYFKEEDTVLSKNSQFQSNKRQTMKQPRISSQRLDDFQVDLDEQPVVSPIPNFKVLKQDSKFKKNPPKNKLFKKSETQEYGNSLLFQTQYQQRKSFCISNVIENEDEEIEEQF